MSDLKKKKPMTASDYIKNQPHMQGKPLTIQNTFSALAEYPPLSYAKAVTSDQAEPSTKNPETPNQKSAYYLKPNKQHIFTTNIMKPITLKQLQQFLNQTFYQDSLWPTDNVIKNLTFYEYILVDSKSAEITHYPDKNNPNLISYSTCKILRVANIRDLGFLALHTQQPFSTPGYHLPGYTYTDYQNAFSRTFYHRPYDHSWFISFDIKCPKSTPGWFNEWWYWFGPTNQIYPDTIIKTSYPFYLKHINQTPLGPANQIAFHIDMGIPWICSWHFNLINLLPDMPYSLAREYRIKWWDKYNLERCSLQSIQNFFRTTAQLKQAIHEVSQSLPLLTPSQLTQQSTATTSSPKRPSSPTNSTSTTSSKKKLSAKEKKAKIKQMLSHLMDSSDDEPQQDITSQPTTAGTIYIDSQDPFQIEDLLTFD